MSIKDELRDTKEQFRLLSLYQRFEHVVIMLLTALIAVIVIVAVWNLSLKILFGLVLSGSLDPSDYSVFQAVFGMIFTVIIALEFKKSLLVVAQRAPRHRGPDPLGRHDCAPGRVPEGHHSRPERNRCVAYPGIRRRNLCSGRSLLACARQRSAISGSVRRPVHTAQQAHRLVTKTGSFSSAPRLAPGKTM